MVQAQSDARLGRKRPPHRLLYSYISHKDKETDTKWVYEAAICSDPSTQSQPVLIMASGAFPVAPSGGFDFVNSTSVMFTSHSTTSHICVEAKLMDSLRRISQIYGRISASAMTKVVSAGLAAIGAISRRFRSDVTLRSVSAGGKSHKTKARAVHKG